LTINSKLAENSKSFVEISKLPIDPINEGNENSESSPDKKKLAKSNSSSINAGAESEGKPMIDEFFADLRKEFEEEE
jgi:hypothetical protein